MNIPPITSIDTALEVYYKHSEIGNKEISLLFGRLSSATVAKLKKAVKKEMINKDVFSYGLHKINTTIAYCVWGLDIVDLENRQKKLRALKLQ